MKQVSGAKKQWAKPTVEVAKMNAAESRTTTGMLDGMGTGSNMYS